MTQDSASRYPNSEAFSSNTIPTTPESSTERLMLPRSQSAANVTEPGDVENLAPFGSVSDHDALVLCEMTVARIGSAVASRHPQHIARFVRASARHVVSALRLFRVLATELPGDAP